MLYIGVGKMIDIKLDTKEVELLLKNKFNNDNKVMKRIHKEHMDDLKELSQKYVPYKTGALARSMKSDIKTLNLKVEGTVEYDKEYALKSHEREGRYRKGKRKRFLYKSLMESKKVAMKKLKEELL